MLCDLRIIQQGPFTAEAEPSLIPTAGTVLLRARASLRTPEADVRSGTAEVGSRLVVGKLGPQT